jgi:hypothetical protein
MFSRKKISIESTLHDGAAERARELGYATVAEFVEHLLDRELSSVREAESKERVLAKMKGLGYLQ